MLVKMVFQFKVDSRELQRECELFLQKTNVELLALMYKTSDVSLKSLGDLHELDYWIDEFGHIVLEDGGNDIACCIAMILINVCGFQLLSERESGYSIENCILEHEDTSLVIFPWQGLIQSIENNRSTESCVRFWLTFVNGLSQSLPSSWHPLLEIAYNEDSYWPKDIVDSADRIVNDRIDLMYGISDSLGWNKSTPFEKIRDRFRAWST